MLPWGLSFKTGKHTDCFFKQDDIESAEYLTSPFVMTQDFVYLGTNAERLLPRGFDQADNDGNKIQF